MRRRACPVAQYEADFYAHYTYLLAGETRPPEAVMAGHDTLQEAPPSTSLAPAPSGWTVPGPRDPAATPRTRSLLSHPGSRSTNHSGHELAGPRLGLGASSRADTGRS